MITMDCPGCGEQVDTLAKYCSNCGEAIAAKPSKKTAKAESLQQPQPEIALQKEAAVVDLSSNEQKTTPKEETSLLLNSVIAVVVLVVVMSFDFGSSSSSSTSPTYNATSSPAPTVNKEQLQAGLQALIAGGIIENPKRGNGLAQLDTGQYWGVQTFKDKHAAAMVAFKAIKAEYPAVKLLIIRDRYSGKEIGQYEPAYGLNLD